MKMRLLSTAMEMLMVEKQDKEKERKQVLSERIPPIKLSGLSVQELQVQLNHLMDHQTPFIDFKEMVNPPTDPHNLRRGHEQSNCALNFSF